MDWLTMTPGERLNEAGSELPCPFCQKPRVARSTYIRCNLCGMNWGKEQDIFRHPHTKTIKSSEQEVATTVPPAKSTTEV